MNSSSQKNISDLLKLARKFNCFYLSGLHKGLCKPFIVAGHQVGLIRPDVMKYLHKFPEVFRITGRQVELNPAFRDYKERTTKVADVLLKLKKEEEICALKGWRDECFEVSVPHCHESLLEMDRSACCLFGIRNYGVSVTGYLNHPSKGLCIWLQQRSFTKQTWPGKWDCFVSGGLAVGFGVLETTIKEAAEEASVEGELAKKLIPAGCVSFYFESERGLFPNTEYVYDLELPLDFVPKNADGEVENFELLTADECIQRALSPQFKTTSAPVLLDFLIRKGHINPENEPNYRYLVELLHVPLQSVYMWPYTSVAALNGDSQEQRNEYT
ncbi:NUDIX domain-containing protein [Phthorimaea operculella]|nr:NUDIX domain-containing protein [Phthorimaea operculella]